MIGSLSLSSEVGGERGTHAEGAAGAVVDARDGGARLAAVEPAGVVVLALAPATVEGVVDGEVEIEAAQSASGGEAEHGAGAGGGAVGERSGRQVEELRAAAPAARVQRADL